MYNSFKFLEKIYFVRTSGSEDERRAAELICKEASKYDGVEAHIETFPVDGYVINHAYLKFSDPDIEVPYVGVGMSGNTPDGGVDGDFVYVANLLEAEMMNLEGKIVLITSKIIENQLYRKLVEKKPAALILATGNVYLDDEDVDLDPYKYRERHYSVGVIPAVCIRMRDAERIVAARPKRAHVELNQNQYKCDSQNVVATIRGTSKPEEIITFSAHYDSVSYSRGAYDNGTGSICILELLAYFSQHKPARTLRFVWCGSEEDGLLGSKAYVQQHKDELDKTVFNINVDMVGATLGFDTATASSNISLVHYLNYLSKQTGFPIVTRQGVASTDSTPFADNGVPAVSFGRMAPQGGATIHSRNDLIERLSEQNYYRTCRFIEIFASNLVNAAIFPVEREIPDNVKEDLDYYNLRKVRPAGSGFRR